MSAALFTEVMIKGDSELPIHQCEFIFLSNRQRDRTYHRTYHAIGRKLDGLI